MRNPFRLVKWFLLPPVDVAELRGAGIKITPRAFGKDWRLPIVNKFRE